MLIKSSLKEDVNPIILVVYIKDKEKAERFPGCFSKQNSLVYSVVINIEPVIFYY